ncbi:MAG: family 43 glycosylhydrolase [bacterium]|nr:family 43 glycosylhydrolase [bacterium]
MISYGVRCYKSENLCDWTDIGLIIPPDTDDKESPLHPTSKAERPHIVYNRKTKKYVCFLKVIMPDGTQKTTILTSDSFLGGYKIVRKNWQPLGKNAGDFDLQTDEETGKAYYIFEEVHSRLIIAELTEDYLDTTGVYSVHFENGCPPYVREAPAHFMRNGKHYLVTSGTTGYYPNPSQLAVSDNWHGPYKILNNPHLNDISQTSYHSQISSVFKVDGKDLYIACADRWLPDRMFLEYDMYAKLFEVSHTKGLKADWSAVEKQCASHGVDMMPDISKADYVWLPFRFENENGILEWRNEWCPGIKFY